MSSRGSLSKLTKENFPDNVQPRNLSTVKRKCNIRRRVEITPLPQSQLNLEEEGANEPLTFPAFNGATSSECAEATKPNSDANKQKNDSFEICFAPLETPAKGTDHKSTETKFSNKINRQLKHEFATPNNKVSTKVQCCVNMKSYIKTPIDKLCNVKQVDKTQKENCNKSNDIHNKLDQTFTKIHVNNVQYLILNRLGKGGSSEVYQCYDIEMKANRAIKIVSLQNAETAAGYINEVKLLQKLQKCDKIIKLFDFEIRKTEQTLLMILEMGGPDLSKILKESLLSSNHLPMHILMYYWMEMLYAVKQLHSHNVSHLDLKPANFLKAGGNLKLIDFGISKCIQNGTTGAVKTVQGSIQYISPEAVSDEKSTDINSPSCGNYKDKTSLKSDIWSLGCILYQMVYRRTPFQHITHMEKVWLAAIRNPEYKIEFPEATWVPQKIIDTMKHCLQFNMKSRPSIDELINDYEHMYKQL